MAIQAHPRQLATPQTAQNLVINGGMRLNKNQNAPYSSAGETLDLWDLVNPGTVDLTTDSFSGEQAMLVNDDDSNNSTYIKQEIKEVSHVRDRTVTLSVQVKEGPNSPSTDLGIEIWDSDGTNTSQNRDFISLDTTFQQVDVSHTVQADATELEVRIYPASGSSSLDTSQTGEAIIDGVSLTAGQFPTVYQPRLTGHETLLTQLSVDFIAVDSKSSGTDGGSSVAGFQKRDLNTVRRNLIDGASLSNSEITLPPGDYYIEAVAPSFDVASNQLFIFDTVQSSRILVGQDAYSGNGAGSQAHVDGVISLDQETPIYAEHYTDQSVSTTGLGVANSNGEQEVYTTVKIWDVD